MEKIPNRWLTPSAYLLVLFALFLPFCHFKCANMKVATVSGTDMIIRGNISLSGEMKKFTEDLWATKMAEDIQERDKRVKMNTWIVLVAVAAVTGIIIFFTGLRSRYNIQRAIAISGLFCLLIFVLTRNEFFQINKLMNNEDETYNDLGNAGIVSVGLGVGFWLSAAGFALATAFNFTNRSPVYEQFDEYEDGEVVNGG